MKLYNSLTKQLEDIKPLIDGKISMYSCGPTVYDNLHIGNLSAFIYADLLIRTLRSHYNVTAVMNITDVDDKTIRDSKRDYADLEPKAALTNLTRKYEEVFMRDIAQTGNDVAAVSFIRATEAIDDMVSLTQTLLDKNIAYVAEDGVYFSISSYEAAGFDYGILQTLDRSHEHARIANDEYDKDHASDFALWKQAEPGEPSWEATFTHKGESVSMAGRPGWHIECSAMSQKLLGVPFDIHTGGIDLKFPHHENEIAQTLAATGKSALANIFVHNNHLLIDGRKMSKSLGNVFTLRDIEDKGYDLVAFRLLVLSSHYRTESNFTWDILEAAQNRLKHWRAAADLRWQLPKSQDTINLQSILENDLDTPAALAAIDTSIDTLTANDQSPSDQMIDSISQLLGIDLTGHDISDEQNKTLADRQAAREAKDWKLSDTLRDELTDQGIGIRDTDSGQVWYRL